MIYSINFIFINLGIMLDGVIYLVLGLLLHNSKIGAIITLLVSGIGVVTTFLNKMGVTGGGRNIVLARTYFGKKNPGEKAEYIRLSYATSMHEIEKGLDRIEKWLKDNRK